MTTNEIFCASRLVRVRELQAENARLREKLAASRAELESLRSHFDLALTAALDERELPEGGRLVIVDGWNLLLGSGSVLSVAERRLSPQEKRVALLELVRQWLGEHPLDFMWVVFDGDRAESSREGRLRFSFTGGTGRHRADRMICDYLRMRRVTGGAREVVVATDDRDFAREALALGAQVEKIFLPNSP